MKTLIVGTGIIGTIYGWALSEAGVDVTHFVRKGKSQRVQDGLKLDVLDERAGHKKYNITTYLAKCVEVLSPADAYELIIVATNTDQVEDAVKMLAPLSGNATFLIFSGNWEGLDAIDQSLPHERYLLGYPDGGGTIRNGVYWTNLGSEVHLGSIEGNSTATLEQVRALFVQADMKPDMQENMLHWLWVHDAGVIGFAAGFAKHADMREYLADKTLLRQCILSTKELYKLCKLRGVDLKKYPEISFMNFPVWLVTRLFIRNFKRNESMQRFTAHAASPGSLRETKVSYASVMKTAGQLGFEMPYTKVLGTHLQNV
jgi:2-dehydropantoate 2-reductase